MRESQAGWHGCRPISTASIMASHCRSSVGRRPATITFGIFRSIPTDENGLIAKVGQSIPNLILCGLSTNGVKRSLRTRSRFDLSRLAGSHASRTRHTNRNQSGNIGMNAPLTLAQIPANMVVSWSAVGFLDELIFHHDPHPDA